MRYLLCLVCLLTPSMSFAQLNTLGVYTDERAVTCLTHDTPGPHTLYVMVRISNGATGARFRLEYSSGFTGTLLSSSSPWSNVTGDPSTGVTVMFDTACQVGDIAVMTLNFMFAGGSPDCSWIRTAKHPLSAAGGPEISNCLFQFVPAYWEGTHVTSGFSTDCPNDINYEEHTHFCRPYWEPTIATQASTWGAVKALYR